LRVLIKNHLKIKSRK